MIHSNHTKEKLRIAALRQFKNGMPKATKEKISASIIGIKNPNYKGQNIGKQMVHVWIKQKYGKPKYCEICKIKSAKSYHWANKNHMYKRLKNNWFRLCHSCHFKYDIKYNNRKYGIGNNRKNKSYVKNRDI